MGNNSILRIELLSLNLSQDWEGNAPDSDLDEAHKNVVGPI